LTMPPFGLAPYPRGPRSGPGSSVPVHQHLLDPIRATGRHVSTSRLCGCTKRLGCAGAPKPPASGSELSLLNPSRHVAVLDSGEIGDCLHPVPSPPMLSSPSLKRFDSPNIPANLFPAGQSFRSFTTVRLRYNLPICLPSCQIGLSFRLASEDFYFQASAEVVARSDAGYRYCANWTTCTGRTSTGWINS